MHRPARGSAVGVALAPYEPACMTVTADGHWVDYSTATFADPVGKVMPSVLR